MKRLSDTFLCQQLKLNSYLMSCKLSMKEANVTGIINGWQCLGTTFDNMSVTKGKCLQEYGLRKTTIRGRVAEQSLKPRFTHTDNDNITFTDRSSWLGFDSFDSILCLQRTMAIHIANIIPGRNVVASYSYISILCVFSNVRPNNVFSLSSNYSSSDYLLS